MGTDFETDFGLRPEPAVSAEMSVLRADLAGGDLQPVPEEDCLYQAAPVHALRKTDPQRSGGVLRGLQEEPDKYYSGKKSLAAQGSGGVCGIWLQVQKQKIMGEAVRPGNGTGIWSTDRAVGDR